jgi:hypothetical protein
MRIVASYQEVENKQKLGSLKLALPFYDSEIIFIVGDSNNKFCPSTKLILWSDKSYSIISSIAFKEEIVDILYDTYSFFVILKNKILLFNILNFKYVCTLEDFNSISKVKNYISSSNDSLNFIHISMIIPNHLKINKFKLDSYSQIYSRFQTNLVIKDFKKIQFIETDFFGEYIAVVNYSGTKIKIYSSDNYCCIYKFYRGKSEALIKSLNFDNRNRYLAVVSNRKTIHFFKLFKKKDNSNSFISESNYSQSFVKSEYKKSYLFSSNDGISDDEVEKSSMKNLLSNIKVVDKNLNYF